MIAQFYKYTRPSIEFYYKKKVARFILIITPPPSTLENIISHPCIFAPSKMTEILSTLFRFWNNNENFQMFNISANIEVTKKAKNIFKSL